MLFKKLKTKCGYNPIKITTRININACKGEKTKCGIFSLIKTSIEGAKVIDIDVIASRLYRSDPMPLIRRAFPELMAKNVVGVQAMSGPIGIAAAMRFIYRDEMELYNELV